MVVAARRLIAASWLLLAPSPTAAFAALSNAGSAIPLGSTPPAVSRFCRERAVLRTFVVLCPKRYPLVRTSQVTGSGSSLLGPSFYWASFNDFTGFDFYDYGHLVVGGQRPPFSLAGSPGQTWPRPGRPQPVSQLGLPRLITTPMQGGGTFIAQRPARILRHATVLRSDALVLLAAPYPKGGFMGGHVIILWNWHGHGYMLSFHFDGSRAGRVYTQSERVATALAVAASFAPIAP